MMSKNALVIIAVVGVIAIAGIWLLKGSSKTTPTPSYQASPTSQESASPSAQVSQNLVRITSSGFEPQTITVKAGESVIWVNENTVSHQVDSVVHPTHQVYPPLNTVGMLPAGESKSLVFADKGTYKYHDHLNPSLTGSVVVE
ncbi:MAG: Plastocyanin [Candidatus Daviesbacteria bacterium GW2011_GWF2_38_6]|uniref:Plastocyanin n=1 Tax=Candidatus Daviesbacteria bacterium GW2011_GWF2_38_6 TaxID=1618432 RepID=A0A0G0KF98_9BACT|nr:MAG: Plastocyanin [Candidatus Daviesbacteria bacterium GW2011_GWF2_38_6]